MKSNIHRIIFQTHQEQIYIYKPEQQQLNLQQYSKSNNSDRENHRTTPLSTLVDFSGELVGGIVEVIDMRYGDVAQVDSVDSINSAVQESY
ncbi:hypothetical protein CsSME_00015760 [Camellia sinensis var. sinensis]